MINLTEQDKKKITNFALDLHSDYEPHDVEIEPNQLVTVIVKETKDRYLNILPAGRIAVGYAEDILKSIEKGKTGIY